MSIPQRFGIWNRPKLTTDEAFKIADRKRKRKGLAPLTNKMPSCVRVKIKEPKEGETDGRRSNGRRGKTR